MNPELVKLVGKAAEALRQDQDGVPFKPWDGLPKHVQQEYLRDAERALRAILPDVLTPSEAARRGLRDAGGLDSCAGAFRARLAEFMGDRDG